MGSKLVRSRQIIHFFTLVFLISTSVVQGQTTKTPEVSIDYPHEKVYYYNGDSQVNVLLALDEVHIKKVGSNSISSIVGTTSRAMKTEPNGNAFVRFAASAYTRDRLVEYAKSLDSTKGSPSAILYHQSSADRDNATTPAMVLENRISIKLTGGQQISSIAAQYDLEIERIIDYSPNTYILRSNSSDVLYSLKTANELKENNPTVIFANPLIRRTMAPRLIPNDSLFNQQWHLENTGQALGSVPGNDVNIVDAWDVATGNGNIIAIIDTGVQVGHVDLVANLRTDIDIDFNDPDDDASPQFSDHGTACAGIAAGVGNNGMGIVGAAFDSEIVGIRLIEAGFSDQDEADALSHQLTESAADRVDIYSNSWGPFDDASRLETFTALGEAAVVAGINSGRGGLGAIYVWAAGNGLQSGDNANYDGYASSRYTVGVGATGGDGTFSYYSEPGASMLVNTPSSYNPGVGTTTTSTNFTAPHDEYTSGFGGTSSACPLAAGIISLMLEANPALTWLDVQHILVDTAVKNDPIHAGWIANGTGRLFNHQYGFGRIDADAAVLAAQAHTNVFPTTQLAGADSDVGTLPETIPDSDVNGVTRTATIDSGAVTDFGIEHVELTIDITHTYRGDLKITLTSPSGMVSVMSEQHNDANDDYSSWKFTSVAHWGEDPNGTWTLNVVDEVLDDFGSVDGWTLAIHGTSGSQLPIPTMKVPFFETANVVPEK